MLVAAAECEQSHVLVAGKYKVEADDKSAVSCMYHPERKLTEICLQEKWNRIKLVEESGKMIQYYILQEAPSIHLVLKRILS
jgi:hypothetical protein